MSLEQRLGAVLLPLSIVVNGCCFAPPAPRAAPAPNGTIVPGAVGPGGSTVVSGSGIPPLEAATPPPPVAAPAPVEPEDPRAICAALPRSRPLPAAAALETRLVPRAAPRWLVARTNLPDGMAIRGHVRRVGGDLLVDQARVPVIDGCLLMGPFSMPAVGPGSYEVGVFGLDVTYQTEAVLAVIGEHGENLRGRFTLPEDDYVIRGVRYPGNTAFYWEGTFTVGDESAAPRGRARP